MSNIAVQDSNSAIAVEYAVDGPRSVSSLAQGRSRLLGVGLADVTGNTYFITEDVAGALNQAACSNRVYDDTVFALAVERTFGLQPATSFDSVSTMCDMLAEAPAVQGIASLLRDRSCRSHSTLTPRSQSDIANSTINAARRTIGVYQWLLAVVKTEGMEYVYRAIELPVVLPTAAMSLAGVRVDVSRLNELLESYRINLEISRYQIWESAGHSLNPDSHSELCTLLFDRLRLPVLRSTPSGLPAVSDAALKRLQRLHPIVATIQRYQETRPIVSALESLLAFVDPSTQRVHPELNPLGAVTGRFACSMPNLHSIPKAILDAFIAAEDHLLVDADFSQIELRVLAHFSREPAFLEAYTGHVDIHRRTAAAVLGVAEDQVSSEDRDRLGKPVNFGIIYGETEFGLADNLDVSLEQASDFIAGYFRAYPVVAAWIRQVQNDAFDCGWVQTRYGRRRYLPDIGSHDAGLASRADRQAVNTIIQGTAADINKLAISRLFHALPPDCRLLLTVHDAVLLEVPRHRVEEVVNLARMVMETPPTGFSVPLKVDVGYGKTWHDCKRCRSGTQHY